MPIDAFNILNKSQITSVSFRGVNGGEKMRENKIIKKINVSNLWVSLNP